ncbi:hypothetical protein HYALB_00009054, partial [Hymenoscyphus albidus]
TNVHFYKADVTSPEEVAQVATEIRAQHGNPTVLINNAGIAGSKSILVEPIESTKTGFAVNVLAHFICIKECLPAMVEKNHGHIGCLTSTASFITPSGFSSYGSSKAAAMAFMGAWFRNSNVDIRLLIFEPDISILVIRQVMSGRSGLILVPASLDFLRRLRGMPIWYQMFIRGQAGNLLAKNGK